MASPIPFTLGSVVNVKSGTFKGKNIIHKVSFFVNAKGYITFKYTSNHGGWFCHDICELLEPPSEKSIKKLIKSLGREDLF